MRVVFVECGRKFGKTEYMMYFLSRIAMTIPNAALYYIAPFTNQAGELLWHNGRLPNFFPDWKKEKYQIRCRNSDYRIMFGFNGSFIKLAGADNYEAYRGVNPHGIGYEEFKDHHPMFHKGMRPNLLTHKAPLLVIGTPPETVDNQFCRMADYAKKNKNQAWFNFPTWANPHVDLQWLREEKEELFELGNEDEWFREYCAKRVKSGKKQIFGRFDDNVHILPYKIAMKMIERTRRDWSFYCTADPASGSTFAILFTAIHKYKKVVIHLDEIYEKTPANMATSKMMEGVEETENRGVLKVIEEIHPWYEDWTFTYDEAALWFANEVLDNYGESHPEINFIPTCKSEISKKAKPNDAKPGTGLINDQIAANKFFMTDRCKNFKFEINNYVKDDKGKVPKENDHLIDNARYTNQAANYSLPKEQRPEEKDKDEMKRAHSPRDDYEEESKEYDYEEQFDDAIGGWY